MKQKYGYNRVVNIATFKSEGTRSAIQTVCRGLGISINQANYYSSLVVMDGPNAKSIKTCLEEYETNGDCKRLINELRNEEGLIETILKVENLICGKGIHASGIYIFPCDAHEMNAVMKAPNGQPITQYSMIDSDYQGGLKIDSLTIEAGDRIRKTMDLLLKEGKMEWQGSLRKTYDKYLHPDVLEYKADEMWKMLYTGEVINAFQMETVVGGTALRKVQPHTLDEVIATNSLMRLSCEGIQPIDRFVLHKNNPSAWIKEMQDFGLNSEEIEVMKKHLSKSYGVACTQEDVMRLSMDSKVANFTLVGANKLRKAIAKTKAKHLISEIKNEFYLNGIDNNVRRVMLDYVWEMCIVPQLGYSFSEPHTSGYSLILLQEMNLCYTYGSLYWKVACLSVNSGAINEDVSRGTDYGAIARAIGNMPLGFVLPPDINRAGLEFLPLASENKALFSLTAINGIGKDVAVSIIENRPYSSLSDFYAKCIDTKLVPVSKGYSLIKAGAFDCINSDRRKLMMDYVSRVTETKTKLTTANLAKLLEYNLIPSELEEEITLYNFKKIVFAKNNLVSANLYRIPSQCVKYAETKILNNIIDAFDYDNNGALCLDSKLFDKWYKVQIGKLTNWLSSDDAVYNFNNHLKAMNWNKYCSGSIEEWEMDAISYYTKKHELDYVPLDKYFKIENYNELSQEPVVVETKKWGKSSFNIYQLSTIAGVVVHKDKNKGLVSINTPNGIVDIKLDKGKFVHYDRKVDGGDSWFKKGTKLILVGYRRGETFVSKTYTTSIYKHSIIKIDAYNSEKVSFRLDREFAQTNELD